MPAPSLLLSQTERGLDWLNQFEPEDQADAKLLLDAVRWVSAIEFDSTIRDSVEELLKVATQPIAFFIERELQKPGGYIQRFYKERTKPARIYGVALPPVSPAKGYSPEVGSEGILANIATSMCREDPKRRFIHPTAESIRKNKIRSFIVLTDTIGTGNQLSNFLDSLWRLHSVKSWKSFGLVKIQVISYAATEEGRSNISRHPSRPSVEAAIACPTIFNIFSAADSKRMDTLCHKYNPVRNVPSWLGHGGGGVLMAYAHGMPNNAPFIFYRRSKRWKPLFAGRSTGSVSKSVATGLRPVDARRQLEAMHQTRLAGSAWLSQLTSSGSNLILVLASLNRPPRTETAIAARTGLRLNEVRKLIRVGIHYGWISSQIRLTDAGYRELAHLRRTGPLLRPSSENAEILYYPTSLRSPAGSI